MDRGGEHVPVIGVGQRQRFDQRLMPGHNRIRKGTAHRRSCALERRLGEVRALAENAPEAFVEDAR